MEEQKGTDGYPLSLKDFIPWLEESFAEKYEQSLHGVKERFLCIFSLFKSSRIQFIQNHSCQNRADQLEIGFLSARAEAERTACLLLVI